VRRRAGANLKELDAPKGESVYAWGKMVWLPSTYVYRVGGGPKSLRGAPAVSISNESARMVFLFLTTLPRSVEIDVALEAWLFERPAVLAALLVAERQAAVAGQLEDDVFGGASGNLVAD
jgi:hypothetical protein